MRSQAPHLPCSPLPSPVRQERTAALAEVEEIQTEAVLEDAGAACGAMPLPDVVCGPNAPDGSALVPVGAADGQTVQVEAEEVNAEATPMVPGPNKAASSWTPSVVGAVNASLCFALGWFYPSIAPHFYTFFLMLFRIFR